MQPFILKTLMESSDVCFLIQLAKEKHNIEGVTFLGGEPMLQAKGLSEVADWCNKNDLSVMTFTGYTLENLRNENIAGVETLIANTDILVDGRYDEMLQETERNWVGSRNQCFYFLTNRYEKNVVYDTRYAHSVELRIRTDGTIQSNGFPL
jgi:anaerobic ribonucleoside-triphosphate reductase activating protein